MVNHPRRSVYWIMHCYDTSFDRLDTPVRMLCGPVTFGWLYNCVSELTQGRLYICTYVHT